MSSVQKSGGKMVPVVLVGREEESHITDREDKVCILRKISTEFPCRRTRED
jgi:hypothetical protein